MNIQINSYENQFKGKTTDCLILGLNSTIAPGNDNPTLHKTERIIHTQIKLTCQMLVIKLHFICISIII